MTRRRKYLNYLLNPLELLRTQKVLHVNPTVAPQRNEPEITKIYVYDYNLTEAAERSLPKVQDCFPYLQSGKIT